MTSVAAVAGSPKQYTLYFFSLSTFKVKQIAYYALAALAALVGTTFLFYGRRVFSLTVAAFVSIPFYLAAVYFANKGYQIWDFWIIYKGSNLPVISMLSLKVPLSFLMSLSFE